MTDAERLTLATTLNEAKPTVRGCEVEGYTVRGVDMDGVPLVTIADPSHQDAPALGMKAEIFGTQRGLDAIYRWIEEIERCDAASEELGDHDEEPNE